MAAALYGRPPSFVHCRRLTDEHGMVQFALGDKPDLAFGYCTDDNARALLICVMALRVHDALGAQAQSPDPAIEYVGERALAFLRKAQRPDGLFHNLMDAGGQFIDEIGSQECLARSLWACAVTVRCAPNESWRQSAGEILRLALTRLDCLQALRARAYAILALTAAVAPQLAAPVAPLALQLDAGLEETARTALDAQARRLEAEFHAGAVQGWDWWEPELTWGNARLPEALLRAACATRDARLKSTGLRALHFLSSLTQPGDTFEAIGNKGWCRRGGARATYDQQPIEACAMVDAWLAAARATGDEAFAHKALAAFAWFFGSNSEGISLARPDIGGCYDGLMPGRPNLNMGAESTLSYLHAHLAIAAGLRLGQR
jgi:hypothetical protein